MKLLEELQEAIKSGDSLRIEQVKRALLLETRDKSLDSNFLDSIRGKTLYKNLVRISEGQEFSQLEYMKILSSLFTHCIIESEKTGKDIEEYPIHEMYIMLGNFLHGSPSVIQECQKFISDRYGEFMIKS